MIDREKVIKDNAIRGLQSAIEISGALDCKDACIVSDDWVICTHIDSNGNDKHPVDWFCADGVKRNE